MILRYIADGVFLVLPILHHHLMLLILLFGLYLSVLLGLIDRLGNGNAWAAIFFTEVHVLPKFALECQLVTLRVILDDLVHTKDIDHVVQGLRELLRLLEVHEVALLPMLDEDYDACEDEPGHDKERESRDSQGRV
jgi:hypothetical protein